eukprot:107151_1
MDDTLTLNDEQICLNSRSVSPAALWSNESNSPRSRSKSKSKSKSRGSRSVTLSLTDFKDDIDFMRQKTVSNVFSPTPTPKGPDQDQEKDEKEEKEDRPIKTMVVTLHKDSDEMEPHFVTPSPSPAPSGSFDILIADTSNDYMTTSMIHHNNNFIKQDQEFNENWVVNIDGIINMDEKEETEELEMDLSSLCVEVS